MPRKKSMRERLKDAFRRVVDTHGCAMIDWRFSEAIYYELADAAQRSLRKKRKRRIGR